LTAPYDLTPRAEQDLNDIALYTIQKWGAAQMETYLRQLEERFRWLAENPALGHLRKDVHPGYRSWPQGRHVNFYVRQADRIAIIGVPHRAMDIGAYFGKLE
jgi:toxin ParE1/3/4